MDVQSMQALQWFVLSFSATRLLMVISVKKWSRLLLWDHHKYKLYLPSLFCSVCRPQTASLPAAHVATEKVRRNKNNEKVSKPFSSNSLMTSVRVAYEGYFSRRCKCDLTKCGCRRRAIILAGKFHVFSTAVQSVKCWHVRHIGRKHNYYHHSVSP